MFEAIWIYRHSCFDILP